MEEKLRQNPSNCIKIVLFGPESTGKTTLSKQLAAHYGTQLVGEYMREYLQDKWDAKKEVCVYDDLLPIAEGQMRLENEAAQKTNTILVCDTNLLELKVYGEFYYEGEIPKALDKISLENVYDLYLLTYIDVPWVQDDLRDLPHQREEMFLRFKECLDIYGLKYVILKGDNTTRFNKAIQSIEQLIKTKK
ncbi:AAA family ATPase [Aquimarina pacifica]|uniref:AAA family ATPase n=1 Tax=Aquimarina pacifica TaxID=1296415 RepID=UPI0004707B34|nr:ATP-binding protein [Aquimarina pacifica]